MRIGFRMVANGIAALSMALPVIAPASSAPSADPAEFTVRLVVNGRSYPPNAVAAFPRLYAYVDLREPALMRGYTSLAELHRAHPQLAGVSVNSSSKVDFYENINCGGDGFR